MGERKKNLLEIIEWSKRYKWHARYVAPCAMACMHSLMYNMFHRDSLRRRHETIRYWNELAYNREMVLYLFIFFFLLFLPFILLVSWCLKRFRQARNLPFVGRPHISPSHVCELCKRGKVHTPYLERCLDKSACENILRESSV